jgi:hypothetical protein
MIGWTRAILFVRSMCSSMRWNCASWGSMASPRQRPAGRDIIRRRCSSFTLLGEQEQARDAAASGSALDPTFTIRRYRVNTPSDHPSFLAARQRFCEGMRLAGVPEG